MTYRDIPCLKSPIDLALYLLLIQRLRPKTVFEIGTKYGGSALWFADMLAVHGIESAQVISVDLNPSALITDSRIRFLQGDARSLHDLFDAAMLRTFPKPWLVIEDSSHLFEDALAVLEFFHPFMESGEYIVVEDGSLSQFSDPMYQRFQDGPNRAVAAFLKRRGAEYDIDTELCDWFGYNATYNPNGWLRRK